MYTKHNSVQFEKIDMAQLQKFLHMLEEEFSYLLPRFELELDGSGTFHYFNPISGNAHIPIKEADFDNIEELNAMTKKMHEFFVFKGNENV